MSTETPKSPPDRRDADDSDSDVVGFADAPDPREQPARHVAVVDSVTVKPTPRPAPVTNTNTTEQTPAPPAQDDQDPPQTVLRGWRKAVVGLLAAIAIFVPWVAGMILSWMPLTRISAHEATREVLVSIVGSTVEVGTMLLVSGSHNVLTWVAPYSRPLMSRIPFNLFITWTVFLFLDPIVTGSYVWYQVDKHPCEAGSGSAQCRVGDSLIRAIGIFRVFGISPLAAVVLSLIPDK
ncbi:hypothetical protein EDB81DRAFT_954386 [Dactylonectria macrodidyma]|uniref:Uncharacterized protein n=1 Tax=Dactylonectria macrodidyma TaxID=307937 RepID=A0A9P9I6N8_9HYPO|nr:hypothetical protein EDB81DRAFT_954386 [Dactylonectria macrodidyma]